MYAGSPKATTKYQQSYRAKKKRKRKIILEPVENNSKG